MVFSMEGRRRNMEIGIAIEEELATGMESGISIGREEKAK